VAPAVDTGVAGRSIEDSTGDAAQPLFGMDIAVARIGAARRAIDAADGEVLLVGRAECFPVCRPDLAWIIALLQAYAAAGADCLYAPGIKSAEQIAAVVAAVTPEPVNLLVGADLPLFVKAEPGHKQSAGQFVPGKEPGLRPGPACQAEFEAFLECGILAHGFLRLRCGDCGHDKLVAFSGKRRGFCPSCGA